MELSGNRSTFSRMPPTSDTAIRTVLEDQPHPGDGYVIRPCAVDEAREVWDLAANDPVIDTNSPYAYVMASDFWGETFLIARDEHGRLAGYVLGVQRPDRKAVFVWQIAVADHARRKGLARRLLSALMTAAAPLGLTRLEATVAPANKPSAAMFRRFADDNGVPCEITGGYPGSAFPEAGSEGERLFEIGPFGH